MSIERIAEEGYNLNISRYISTAVGEEEIRLSEIHRELVDVEKQVRSATAKHNSFLKDLGLPPLPGGDEENSTV